MFNSTKSKLMCFQKNSDMPTNFNNRISMKNGSSIQYVKEYVHLGNTIYIVIYHYNVLTVVSLVYLSVHIIYHITLQMSIVTFL